MAVDLKIPLRYIVGDQLMVPCHRTPGRYTMPIPISMLSDEAALLLIHQELGPGWEREERDLLDGVLGKGAVFVDIGAHWGIHSLHAATAGATVVAVEPDPFNLAMLEAWLAANGLRDRATVVAAALADRVGGAYIRRNTTMGHALLFDPPDPAAVFRSGPFAGQPVYSPVQALRLDGIALPYGRPVMLKIDVEGAELSVLRGATDHLASRRVTHILWEMNAHYDEIARLLLDHGYASAPLNSQNALSTLL